MTTVSADTQVRQTPLYQEHLKLKARMGPFAGWQMPLVFEGTIKEHQSVRTGVGMFDIAHMGVVEVRGPEALAGLQKLSCNNVAALKPGQTQYNMLLNERGGIRDDILIYLLEENHYWVIVNAGNVDKILNWFQATLPKQAFYRYLLHERVPFAVQGPKTLALLQTLFPDFPAQLKPFHFEWMTLLGQRTLVSRTGYTGEDGVEFFVAPDILPVLWNMLLSQGVPACGLAARDTLRLEAALPLYGHELNEETLPIQTAHAWVLKWQKPDFIGKSALLAAQKTPGIQLTLVGLMMEGRAIAREGYMLQEGGTVTSGTFSPTLERPIAMAYVDPGYATLGQLLNVDIRGKWQPARVCTLPFYRRQKI